MGKSALPSDAYITQTNIKGLCHSRLASLASGMNLEDLDEEEPEEEEEEEEEGEDAGKTTNTTIVAPGAADY